MGTETKELIAEIQKLQQESELKTGWISLISHDFKGVFRNLLWLTEAVENEGMSKDDFFKLLPRIKEDAQKNLQTVTDTSDWIKSQINGFEPKKSKIFVLDLFIQLKKEFEEKLEDKKMDFQFKGNESLVFYSDEFLVLFILKKLLDNAIKFSHENGCIEFKALASDDTISLSIKDSGVGMSKETKDLLYSFEGPVFEGTKGEIGAGLGLKVVKNFVSLLAGKIDIITTENVGTKITISLPPN
ncbi:sensor histidine kinase [Arenibacter latericius]|uniref:sensor histidine kinase n=1 Tax=Arenibacter latericius TaxID=86104 RepID=UPI0004095045|nr:HAMP domain-containing sensor histidine kinase [Arenibacter latericius]